MCAASIVWPKTEASSRAPRPDSRAANARGAPKLVGLLLDLRRQLARGRQHQHRGPVPRVLVQLLQVHHAGQEEAWTRREVGGGGRQMSSQGRGGGANVAAGTLAGMRICGPRHQACSIPGHPPHVLPLPVFAMATRSRPLKATGQAWAWMGVGDLKPACLICVVRWGGGAGVCVCAWAPCARMPVCACMHACMHARTCARTCGMHARVRLHAQHTGRCCMLHTACKSLSVCRESTRRWRRAQPRVEPPAAAAVCLRCGMPHLLLLLRAHSALRMHKPHDAHMLPMLLRLHPPC